MRPEKIRAEDKDTLRTEVKYSFIADPSSPGSNNFKRYFSIDPQTGIVSQLNPVMIEDTTSFNLLVKVRIRPKQTYTYYAEISVSL